MGNRHGQPGLGNTDIIQEISVFQSQVAKMEELEGKCKSFCNNARSFYCKSELLIGAVDDDDDQLRLSNKLSQRTLLDDSIDWAMHEFIECPFVQMRTNAEEINNMIREREGLLSHCNELKKRKEMISSSAQIHKEDELNYDSTLASLKLKTDTVLAHMEAFGSILKSIRRRVLLGMAVTQQCRAHMVQQAFEASSIIDDPLARQMQAAIKAYTQAVAAGRPVPAPNCLPLSCPREEYAQAVLALLVARRGMFGVDLSMFDGIPSVLSKSIAFLDKHGLSDEGVFRVNGDNDKIHELRDAFDSGADVDLEVTEQSRPSSVRSPSTPLQHAQGQGTVQGGSWIPASMRTSLRVSSDERPAEGTLATATLSACGDRDLLENAAQVDKDVGHSENQTPPEKAANPTAAANEEHLVEGAAAGEGEGEGNRNKARKDDCECECDLVSTLHRHRYSSYDVASLLKLFLRQLPDPLIPRDCYHEFLDCSADAVDDFLRTVRSRLNQESFPRPNLRCLKLLLGLLVKVTKKSSVNFMSADNLAVVMAPNILVPPTSETPHLKDTQRSITFTKRLIQSVEVLFGESLWEDYPVFVSH